MTFGVILALSALALALAAAIVWKKRGEPASGVLPPTPAITLLLKSPIEIGARDFTATIGRLTGRQVAYRGAIPRREPHEKLPPGDAVYGSLPSFLVRIDAQVILVTHYEARLIHDVSPAGWDIQEPGAREAVDQHTAWLSAQIVEPTPTSPAGYRLPARILETLLDDNCLVLYHPPLNRFKLNGIGTASSLRGDFPVQAVFGV